LPRRSYRNRIAEIWNILFPEQFQEKLRSKSPEIRPGEDRYGNFFVKTAGKPFVKPDDAPRSIVFRDDSFLVVYEKWSVSEDRLLRYKYHYQRPDGWFMRYDMEEEEQAGHPKRHLQASVLGEGLRLPTGEVSCEEVLETIAEQFVR
jgi:hypothetical protein